MLWDKTITLPKCPALSRDVHADVLVIGGGLTGLLCARQLQTAGLSVVVAEAGRIGGGVSGHTTAKVTVQHGAVYHRLVERYGWETALQYYTANREALAAYHVLNGDFDLTMEDGFLFSRIGRGELEQEYQVLKTIGADVLWTETSALPFKTAGILRIPHQANVHPLKLLRCLATDLTIYENTRVRAIHHEVATTDNGARIRAKAIIVATHFPFLNRHGSYFLKLYQHRSYVTVAENVPSFKGMYWEVGENGLTFRRWGNRLLVVGGGHRTGKDGMGWHATDAVIRQYYPDAVITDQWATQDCMTLDGIPYIGRYAKHLPSLYVATGFNGWGMTSAMVAAQLLTGEITGHPKPWASVFDPSRTIWHHQLAVNAAESVKGLLTPTAPRCPHLGCALKWNKAEHSWDCGCHGSRFAQDGTLRNGPATGPLKRKKE